MSPPIIDEIVKNGLEEYKRLRSLGFTKRQAELNTIEAFARAQLLVIGAIRLCNMPETTEEKK